MSRQPLIRHWLNNLTCKSRINPEQWSSSEFEHWHRAVTKLGFNLLEEHEAFWAHLALAETGHFRGTPFFMHMFPKLKALGRLRGISKQALFDNLSLGHLERLRSQLNTDELLTLAIHYELNEYVYKHPFLSDTAGKMTLAEAEAEQKKAAASPTASQASTQGTSEKDAGSTSTPGANATGEGGGSDHKRRASEGQDSRVGNLKRKRASSYDEQQRSKKSRVTATAEEEKGWSIFIADDDTDVL